MVDRKTKASLIAAMGLGLSLAAGTSTAACLANATGSQSCDGTGTWHFVNNQTEGAGQGLLTAVFSCITASGVPADKVNRNNQHFNITTIGDCTLQDSGSTCTNLPGRLVLSDYDCDTKKEEPPK